MINACGEICDEKCRFYGKNCDGCHEIKGKVFWLKEINKEVCPFYHCVDKKGLDHCGYCDELPCQIYFEMRDPQMVDDEVFRQSIETRVEKLKQLVK